MLILEEIFRWHLEAFASKVFKCTFFWWTITFCFFVVFSSYFFHPELALALRISTHLNRLISQIMS